MLADNPVPPKLPFFFAVFWQQSIISTDSIPAQRMQKFRAKHERPGNA